MKLAVCLSQNERLTFQVLQLLSRPCVRFQRAPKSLRNVPLAATAFCMPPFFKPIDDAVSLRIELKLLNTFVFRKCNSVYI